jgi:hypothetical protein
MTITHNHGLSANGWVQYAFSTTTGHFVIKTGATSWSKTHVMQWDVADTPATVGGANRTEGIALGGTTDNANASISAGSSTGSGTTNSISPDAVGGSLDAAASLPPFTGVKYIIKT